MQSNEFNGLMMPVFTAFGWAGEEQALNYALSELENFIRTLYFQLPKEIQVEFPAYGLDRSSQSVYLATGEPAANGLYIAFFARPSNLETSLILTDKVALSKAYRAAQQQPELFEGYLTALGPDWNLRLQQMEYDPDTRVTTHYQDICKDIVGNLHLETIKAAIERAYFLNSEEKWAVPMYISHRLNSEKVAMMGRAITREISQEISRMMPLVYYLIGKVKPKTKTAAKPKKSLVKTQAQADTPIRQPDQVASLERFVYISELAPLHIRRGFINLTPRHWPFFAVNVRTETRPVSVQYGDHEDDKCAAWRLIQDNQVRIVLSPHAQQWLEDNFEPNDLIQVTAIKLDSDRIIIKLEAVA